MKTANVWFSVIPSPLGPITLTANEGGLTSVNVELQKHMLARDPSWIEDGARLRDAARELTEYFAGTRKVFDVPLSWSFGTDFQRDVWRALTGIPLGETVSYGEIAKRVGRPSAVRGVGGAVGRNPWIVIVPCHRVVGASGDMTGFGGGLPRKRWLLQHEGVRVQGGRDQNDPKAWTV